jgi:hypothetical protein
MVSGSILQRQHGSRNHTVFLSSIVDADPDTTYHPDADPDPDPDPDPSYQIKAQTLEKLLE